MATLDPNTLIGILQGKLGNLVFVRTKEGKIIEQGLALHRGAQWVYFTQAAVAGGAAVVIQVTATDRPGHAVTKTLQHAVLLH